MFTRASKVHRLTLRAQDAAPTAARSLRQFSSSLRRDKPRLVVLGSGWGAYEVMRKVDKRRYDVTVISPNTYFAFTPLLSAASVGTLDYNSALEPVRRYPEVRYLQAWADKIDFDRKRVTCMPATGSAARKKIVNPNIENVDDSLKPAASFPGSKPFDLSYDKLVIAVGCYSATFGTPGVAEYGYFLKDVRDAAKIRNRILECFELASQPTVTDEERVGLLHFAIVGGGPTGVEFAAELHDTLITDLQRAYPELAPHCRITLYDVAPQILGSFDKNLAEYAVSKFDRAGINIKGSRHVTKVGEGYLEIKEEGKVPFGLLVWNTGLAPNPLIESITELQKDEKTHSLRITDHFRTIANDGKEMKDVYCIGDASALPDKLPATAQVASQEAQWLVKILNAEAKGRADPGSFVFHNQGMMAYTGGWSAIVDRTKVNEGPKGELTGRAAWLLWRSAYLYKSLSWRNRISLLYHWFATWLGGRRLSRY
ncbi:hypothetical protein B0A53_01432 [Rhodotorula sp. CCFEE 5036]|nr:hypothetical protein B0A53_01432 [Rhodotorula sp. CCFEE 5036]